MKVLDKMSRTVGYLEKIFRLLNEKYFEGALTMPIITVMSTPAAYGHCSIVKNWEQGKGENYEINIGAGTLNRPIEEVCATMCHEMVHLYHVYNGIQDTSRGLSYHNKKFKEKAEKCGLIIEHHDKYGWTITKPSDDMIQFCLDNDLTEVLINRQEMGICFGGGKKGPGKDGAPTPGTIGKKPSSTRKYQCPKCKNSCRATKELNLICGDCNETMLRVD